MKFSILIPAYKRAYLKECIESILVQTYKDFELIIVDDASPEDLFSVISDFHDERLYYYANDKNCGALNVVDNWNKCLSLAKGDFVICMGDDDCLKPDCLEQYNRLIKEYPDLCVFHGQSEIIDDNSEFKDMTVARPVFESVYSLIWHRWTCRSNQYIGDFLFKRKELVREGGFYKLPLAWGSDDLTVVMLAQKAGIANTQSVVFQYRESSSTISSSGSIVMKMNSLKMEKEWYTQFLENPPMANADYKYWLSLKRMMDMYYKKRYSYHITEDLHGYRKLRLVYWIRKRKKYGVSIPIILYSFIMSFRK